MKRNLLFKRKEVWVPTWAGWLSIVLAMVAIALALVRLTPPFLSPYHPLHAPVLVVEGWVDDHSLEAANAISKDYKLIITAGGPIEKGLAYSDYGTFANFGADRMRKLGFTGTNLIAVPSTKAIKDRTYHSALAVHQYLVKNTPYRELDLLSGGVHTRRSWLLYEFACRPDVRVGVYTIRDIEFDPKRWYRSSAGVRTVLSESIGYLYARLLFRPDAYEPVTPLPSGTNSSQR